LHHILTKYQPHITLHKNNITLCNHSAIPHNHNIILRIIIRYLSAMHREEIDLDTKVEDEVKEDLEE
jgi:hypothetical protein